MDNKTRIEKEAEEYSIEQTGTFSSPIVRNYIAGATAEHNKGLKTAIKRLEIEIQQWLIVYPNPQPGTTASFCIDTLNQAIRNIREIDMITSK